MSLLRMVGKRPENVVLAIPSVRRIVAAVIDASRDRHVVQDDT
jgi:hypothetical protein